MARRAQRSWSEPIGLHVGCPGSGKEAVPLLTSLTTSSCSGLLRDKLRHIKPVKSLLNQTSIPIGQYQTRSGLERPTTGAGARLLENRCRSKAKQFLTGCRAEVFALFGKT